MKHIISYSGGLGSAITADLVAKEYGKNNVVLLFADTKIESPDQYRFTKEFVNYLDVEFIRIADGRTPWQVFNDVKFIGNSRIDPCSKILKRDLIRNYLKSNYKPEETIIWIGIDASESHRLKPVVLRNYPWVYRSILIEKDIFLTTAKKKEFSKLIGIEPSIMYKLGFAHDNCGGFCVKAGLGQFKKLYELLPDVYMQNELEEQNAIKRNPNLRPFLKKMIKGEVHYITMKEYREKYLNQITEEESLEFGGCGCALE